MPVIAFPNLDAVRLAMDGGAVPSTIQRAPALVGFGTDGQIWVQPTIALPRDSTPALSRFGATVHKDSDTELTEEVGSWLELAPLVPIALTPDDRPSPVMFDVPDAVGLPALIAEGRRLGAGKVSVRWGEGGRAFVLTESPPFHSLLRTIPCAYVQQVPRVWVEVGWRHPLAEMIDPPRGQIVLLRAPRGWEIVADGPFQAGPEAFVLPDQPIAADGSADLKMPVPVRLIPARGDDLPEMWVLRDQPIDKLRALAEQTDDRLLGRLSIAVGTASGRRVAVLRARPSRGGPPVLVLDALPCVPYLRLPNLYLPVGHRLRPPLRRDAVRQLLAPHADAVVWLEPGESGLFATCALPESAFRPLEEMIEYAQDHQSDPLMPVAIENSFSLGPFVSGDRVVALPRRRPADSSVAAEPVAESPELPIEPTPSHPGLLSRIVRWFAPRPGDATGSHSAPAEGADEPPRSLDPREDRRRVLEERLLTALDIPDGPERAALWSELARLYAAMNRPADAALGWLNAMWESDDPPPQWRRDWLRAETATAQGNRPDADLGRRLTGPPTPAGVRATAAAIAGVSDPGQRSALIESLDRLQRLLDQHEDWLPVRAAWLARLGLTRLNGGDLVGLARTRDRLLERLHDRGLSADLDVPAAVRFAGQRAGDRVDAVRGWLMSAREPIHRWLAGRSSELGVEGSTTGRDPRLHTFGMGTAAAPTGAYANLIVAWGLARLGERGASQYLLSEARGVLGSLDAAHDFLLDTFSVRITQALEGRAGGPLPADLLARLVDLRDLERTDRPARERLLLVKIQHFLRHSRILEPTELVDAFGEGWLDPQAVDGSDRDFAELRYVTDRDELANRLLSAVASAGRDVDRLPKLLTRALDLAPRLGETVAGGILDRLLVALDSWSFAGPPERVEAEVLAVERGLFVAAHFDRAATVQRLLASLNRLLEARRGGDPGESRPVEDALLNMVGQGLRGLRRLGLRAEADRLLDRLGEWVMPGGDVAAERRRRPQAWLLTLRRLLTVAGGWYYIGRDGPATQILDEARLLLFSRELTAEPWRRHQTDLACAYAAALGQAPVRLALTGVEELFGRLPTLSDNLVTNTHFSLAQLRLVEAAIRAVVTDDFALGPAIRRWLDDDEYRVRRRIHRDTRALIEAGQ